MPRQKRLRFAALQEMPNVFDSQRDAPGWFMRRFGAAAPVVVELGCGHGDYLLDRARREPGRGFLGVERNGARLWKGATRALAAGLDNLAFFRSTIEVLDEHVPPGRVAELWVLFPDPLPKTHQGKHRLMAPRFLERYGRLLAPAGILRLKTDSAPFVAFAEQAVGAAGGRVSARGAHAGDADPGAVLTRYERRYRDEGRVILERTFQLD